MPTLRRLLPTPADAVDAGSEYAYPDSSTPVVRANMVSSLDGVAVLDGRVGALTGPVDFVWLDGEPHSPRDDAAVVAAVAGWLGA